MSTETSERKPHAVCVPFPAQGHVTPMMKLAQLLHSIGFFITYVNTEFNHKRLVRSRGPEYVEGYVGFQFKTIPDGLPPSDRDATQDPVALCASLRTNCLGPFRALLTELNSSAGMPQVSYVVSDGVMGFGREAAEELGIPEVQFWTASACGLMGYLQYPELIEKGIVPFKGPVSLLAWNVIGDKAKLLNSSLWKEDRECLKWLDQRESKSVVYVNYGCLTVMTDQHLKEFAWGLANSKRPFLWIVRPDVVMGDSAILPQGFLEETKDRGMVASWCPQVQVLSHPSIGVFLTHCGWNSTLESICGGVPMMCWPFFAEQQTNCRYICTEWGVGMEFNEDVKRGEIEEFVNEMMEGNKGKQMRRKALEWKKKADEATAVGGSSYKNFDRFIKEALHYSE
ncbi:7-deoxyloganetin glucosyltransferase-like isoform X2 [Rhododendron vialii]|uniref:7-deoxyloganetin glucosyltransferase-like isoform X2 n=1 Tax=Rhododendron vialii TaxID=182163 RepID=UPI00265E7530|nr:7-deoxyloganetin glucosyltransferase-like isoform X2 [Rhododendron vialii]